MGIVLISGVPGGVLWLMVLGLISAAVGLVTGGARKPMGTTHSTSDLLAFEAD